MGPGVLQNSYHSSNAVVVVYGFAHTVDGREVPGALREEVAL